MASVKCQIRSDALLSQSMLIVKDRVFGENLAKSQIIIQELTRWVNDIRTPCRQRRVEDTTSIGAEHRVSHKEWLTGPLSERNVRNDVMWYFLAVSWFFTV